VKRLYSSIPTIKKVGGRRYPRIRKTESKYRVKVLIKEQVVPIFVGKGVNICVISQRNSERLKLETQKTQMKIRSYGSRPKRCLGEFTGTIKHNGNVANAVIYIIKDDAETLLSGPVCEALGIISFKEGNVRRIEDTQEGAEEAKVDLIRRFSKLFKGLGKFKNEQV